MVRFPYLARLAVGCLAPCMVALPAVADWPQWGGPTRDFRVAPTELATEWPESGPPVLWRRELGDGTAAIAIAGERLFTMARLGEAREGVVALDRATGETVWERGWEVATWPGFLPDYGEGPHVTPTVAGGRVYAVGLAGRLVCLDEETGRLVWERDLWERFEVRPEPVGPGQLGYASSPLLLDDRLYVAAGGPSRGVMALDPTTGETLWSSLDVLPSFAAPVAIDVDGRRQIVFFLADRAVGLDPADGSLLWQATHETPYEVNASTPVWNGADTLFLSSAYDTGSRAVRLEPFADQTAARELWASREVEVHHQSTVLSNGVVYASSGDFGPAFLTAIRLTDGEVLFKERGFAKANLVGSGDRLVILDEDGVLALATVTADGLTIDARAEVFSTRSWVVPSLVGTTLYARDRREIAAFDLGPRP